MDRYASAKFELGHEFFTSFKSAERQLRGKIDLPLLKRISLGKADPREARLVLIDPQRAVQVFARHVKALYDSQGPLQVWAGGYRVEPTETDLKLWARDVSIAAFAAYAEQQIDTGRDAPEGPDGPLADWWRKLLRYG